MDKKKICNFYSWILCFTVTIFFLFFKQCASLYMSFFKRYLYGYCYLTADKTSLHFIIKHSYYDFKYPTGKL